MNDAAYHPPIDPPSPATALWKQRFNATPLFVAQPKELLPNQGPLPVRDLESQLDLTKNLEGYVRSLARRMSGTLQATSYKPD